MIGLFIGRFQPFHRGHLQAIQQLEDKYRIVIGIGSSETMNTPDNPLSFSERRKLIHTCLPGREIQPIPDREDDSDWVASITDKINFDIVISGNDWTRQCFVDEGYPVEEPPYFHRDRYRATTIREQAAANDETWKNLVPPETVELLEQFNFQQRMQDLIPDQ